MHDLPTERVFIVSDLIVTPRASVRACFAVQTQAGCQTVDATSQCTYILHSSHPPFNHQSQLLYYKKNNQFLPSMLYNLRNHLPIPHKTPQLLWQGLLHIVVVRESPWHVDVDTSTLACQDFRVERLGAEIDYCSIDLVKHDGWQHTQHLHLKFGALDDIDGTDERVNDQGALHAVVHRYGVRFPDDSDGSFGAAGNKDRVVDCSVYLQHLARIVVILN